MEIYAGEKATRLYGNDVWLPDETLVGGTRLLRFDQGADDDAGRRRHSARSTWRCASSSTCSSACALCATSPAYRARCATRPRRTWSSSARTPRTSTRASNGRPSRDGARKVIDFLQDEMGVRKIRFPETSSIGIKPVSREGSERLVRKAIQYALDNGRRLGHARPQGQHHEVHRGRLPRLGLRTRAQREFGAQPIDGGPWLAIEHGRTRRSRSRT